MIYAINPEYTEEVTLNSDTGDNKTVFIIGIVPARVLDYLDSKYIPVRAGKNGTIDVAQIELHQLREYFRQLVRFGLRGWREFMGRGGPVEYKQNHEDIPGVGTYQVVDDSLFDLLPRDVVVELGSKIQRICNMTGDDQKNS